MAHNKVKLSQIISDFIVTLDGDDYASSASDFAIKNFALRGIREIGFDLGKKIVYLYLYHYYLRQIFVPRILQMDMDSGFKKSGQGSWFTE